MQNEHNLIECLKNSNNELPNYNGSSYPKKVMDNAIKYFELRIKKEKLIKKINRKINLL